MTLSILYHHMIKHCPKTLHNFYTRSTQIYTQFVQTRHYLSRLWAMFTQLYKTAQTLAHFIHIYTTSHIYTKKGLEDSTTLYNTLHHSTQVYTTLQKLYLYKTLQKLYTSLPISTRPCSTVYDCTRHYTNLQSSTKLCKTLHNFTHCHNTLHNFTKILQHLTKTLHNSPKLNKTIHNFTNLDTTLCMFLTALQRLYQTL